MQWSDLNLNRFGFKSEPDPVNPGVTEMSTDSNNATPENQKIGNKSGEKEANQIVTGTIIVDCPYKSSSLPARVEISGNDINIYEDTTGGGGTIAGNTATLSFYRTDDNTKYFRFQKRAGKDNDLDNVLELFASPPAANAYNYIFIGNDGIFSNPGVNTVSIFGNIKTAEAASVGNGKIQIGLSKNGGNNNPNIILSDARATYGNNSVDGVTAILSGDRDGLSGIGWRINPLQVDVGIYIGKYNLISGATVATPTLFLSHDLIPDNTVSYNIGSAGAKIKDIYCGSVTPSNGITTTITVGGTNYNFVKGILTSIT